MSSIEINGEIWPGSSPLSILFFIGIIILVVYIIGFYYGMQLEKSNESDRKLEAQESKKKKR